MDRQRVAVYASDPITMAGIAAHLRSCPEIQLLSDRQATEASVCVVAAERLGPDVMTVLQSAAHGCAALGSAPKIVLITNELHQPDLLEAIDYGVVAVLSRDHLDGAHLVTVVASLRPGLAAARSEVLEGVMARFERVERDLLRPKNIAGSRLAPRELDVLRLLAQGCDTGAIAERLSYSERTVKNIVHAVLTTFQSRNRAHAVAHALRAGMI